MSVELSEYEYLLFRRFFEERAGIEIGPEKAYLIELRLDPLRRELDLGSFRQLYLAVRADVGGALSARAVDAVTTNETFWFRDRLPWQYLEQEKMAGFVKQLRGGEKEKIRIWSAASSTGQEAYSTAIMIDRYLKENRIADVPLSRFEILATDICRPVLEAARLGEYDALAAARGLSPAYLAKYFTKAGPRYRIDERIRAAVSFREFNLQSAFAVLGTFDVIFLRYVMIYFSERLRLQIADKLRGSLRKDGVLFLGSSELYKCISAGFATHCFHHGMYYTKK